MKVCVLTTSYPRDERDAAGVFLRDAVEDHSPVGALGDALRRELERPVAVFGVEGWPACGTPVEVLRFHGLDGASLADRIAAAVR